MTKSPFTEEQIKSFLIVSHEIIKKSLAVLDSFEHELNASLITDAQDNALGSLQRGLFMCATNPVYLWLIDQEDKR